MLGALVEIVPAHVRTTCFPLAFALAAALFGTFTPFAALKLTAITGDKASPGFWLMCAAASGFIAAMVIYRSDAIEAREQPAAAQQAWDARPAAHPSGFELHATKDNKRARPVH